VHVVLKLHVDRVVIANPPNPHHTRRRILPAPNGRVSALGVHWPSSTRCICRRATQRSTGCPSKESLMTSTTPPRDPLAAPDAPPVPAAEAPPGAGLPFQKVTVDLYAQAFADTCTVIEVPTGIVLQGICPRCCDTMSFPHLTSVIMVGKSQNATADPPNSPDADSTVIKMLCTCRNVHPYRPADFDGCGAYWNVRIEAP
jgi:hypothetical protein